MALGVYAVWTQVHGAARGRDFEGYIVLMGLILAGHGFTAILHILLTARLARQIRAV